MCSRLRYAVIVTYILFDRVSTYCISHMNRPEVRGRDNGDWYLSSPSLYGSNIGNIVRLLRAQLPTPNTASNDSVMMQSCWTTQCLTLEFKLIFLGRQIIYMSAVETPVVTLQTTEVAGYDRVVCLETTVTFYGGATRVPEVSVNR